MAYDDGWQFLDDRGRLATAPRTPERITAYIQAGATLYDHGLRPASVFGSAHDGADADPAKAGALPTGTAEYLGPGPGLRADDLLRSAPDLVVAVAYGSDHVYALDPDAAKHLEERVPLVVLDVGQGRLLDGTRERFEALAASLGAGEDATAAAGLTGARTRLSAAAARAPEVRVLALSPAGDDTVHLARPTAWPDLRALTGHGVRMAEPGPGPGVSWSTTDWTAVERLEPDVVLVDVRANAVPMHRLAGPGGRWAATARSRVVPWNPELPCSARAHADYFAAVAKALETR
ncbi:ABC transporter substrate-binding protein [Streptomyces sp. PKU-EA00015]|uniref:ABC transporter substrate-binding protein n=1 Tax=Streptomyces sp. PKU-EA00015 TaxID=2748326 RepID=UPI0015A19275|nr:ABC transporter substrate-binding protein [Streptomyces sp. PKU-EA00015]NWF29257.1 ABC transporter substrate-binding protein [Streptomyces sp. PKU-EA00015]